MDHVHAGFMQAASNLLSIGVATTVMFQNTGRNHRTGAAPACGNAAMLSLLLASSLIQTSSALGRSAYLAAHH